MNNSRFYVYLHRRKDTNVVFYIGKGTGARSHKRHNRNKNWFRVVDEASGFTVEYIAKNLTQQEALILENEKLANPDDNWELINHIGPVIKFNLSREELLAHLYYSESSPSGLRWVKARSSNALKDSVAGAYNAEGWKIRLNGKRTSTCRIVAILHNLIIEDCVVDHIDGNTDNNCISNLRVVSSALNARNSKQRKDNISGEHGVSFNKRREAWVAQWSELDGSRGQKWFSVSKFGYEEAKLLAVKYRQKAVEELNAAGAGYTDRHGT